MSVPEPTQVTADLCNVECDSVGVLILFGERVDSSALPGALSAQPLHRISMSAAGASKLQDLLLDLLRAQDAA